MDIHAWISIHGYLVSSPGSGSAHLVRNPGHLQIWPLARKFNSKLTPPEILDFSEESMAWAFQLYEIMLIS